MSCIIEHIPSISAIYYALLQNGYEFYAIERHENFNRTIESYARAETIPSFFSEVKQNTCDVYPYWPRAYILETATFFLNKSLDEFLYLDEFKNRILSATNISSEEKDDSLWDWITGFPSALRDVINSGGFNRYMEWEREWISVQNSRYCDELGLLDKILMDCREKYHPSCQHIRIVLCPIKCVYSSDYHISGDSFIFTSGDMQNSSILHEYLHTVVHPVLERVVITDKRKYPDIDESYYFDGGEQGYRNAFEEYAVRSLTDKVMRQEGPSDLSAYLEQLTKA